MSCISRGLDVVQSGSIRAGGAPGTMTVLVDWGFPDAAGRTAGAKLRGSRTLMHLLALH